MVLSRINYGLLIYGSADKNIMLPLQTLQNKLVKVLLNRNYRTPTNEIHDVMEILKVEDNYKLEILSFVHRFIDKKLTSVFNDYYKTLRDCHTVNTRNSKYTLRDPMYKTKIGRNSVKQKGVQFWNGTVNDMKEISKSKIF